MVSLRVRFINPEFGQISPWWDIKDINLAPPLKLKYEDDRELIPVFLLIIN